MQFSNEFERFSLRFELPVEIVEIVAIIDGSVNANNFVITSFVINFEKLKMKFLRKLIKKNKSTNINIYNRREV